MPGVSVVIASWNGLEQLRECIPAVRDQTDPRCEWEVLVLDNGSGDGTGEWLRRHHPSVRLIVQSRNVGFSAGNNLLAKEARFDSLALLNNDARPEPDWLRELVRAIEAAPREVAAVSGLIVDWDAERLDFGCGVMTFDGHAFQLGQGRLLDKAPMPSPGMELPFACGGNMLIRRELFLALGGFDEDYFAYMEDVDLGWRLWSSGHRVLSAPAARVRHRSMATSDRLGVYNRGQLFERNAFFTVYKNYEDGVWEKLMPAVLLTLTSRTGTMLIENNSGGASLGFDPFAGGFSGEVEAADRGRSAGARRRLLSWLSGRSEDAALLDDPRSISQLRALASIIRSMDSGTEKRRAIQARRTRPDREIFERFPLYVVPTYPGDQALFESPAFEAWLPDDVPFVRRRLDEVIEVV